MDAGTSANMLRLPSGISGTSMSRSGQQRLGLHPITSSFISTAAEDNDSSDGSSIVSSDMPGMLLFHQFMFADIYYILYL